RLLSPPPLFYCTDAATLEISTLSLHDALPISSRMISRSAANSPSISDCDTSSTPHGCSISITRPRFVPASSRGSFQLRRPDSCRSEEHTSELQSLTNLVCRLLLEKKNIQ